MSSPGSGFCINCGAQLEARHRFCWNCGAERWAPEPEPPAAKAPPGPGTTAFAPPGAPAAKPPSLRGAGFFFAAGAVFWLISLAQTAAVLAAPNGRAQLAAQLASQGTPADSQGLLLWVYGAVLVGFTVVAACLHGVAYYGLRGMRRWGWVTAVLVAGLWSLVLIGIPVLYVLLKRTTRSAFGFA